MATLDALEPPPGSLDIAEPSYALDTAVEILRLRGSALMLAGVGHQVSLGWGYPSSDGWALTWAAMFLIFARANRTSPSPGRFTTEHARYLIALLFLAFLVATHTDHLLLWRFIGSPLPHLRELRWACGDGWPLFPFTIHSPFFLQRYNHVGFQPLAAFLGGYVFCCLSAGLRRGRRGARFLVAALSLLLLLTAAWRLSDERLLRNVVRHWPRYGTSLAPVVAGAVQDAFIAWAATCGRGAAMNAMACRSVLLLARAHWCIYLGVVWLFWR